MSSRQVKPSGARSATTSITRSGLPLRLLRTTSAVLGSTAAKMRGRGDIPEELRSGPPLRLTLHASWPALCVQSEHLCRPPTTCLKRIDRRIAQLAPTVSTIFPFGCGRKPSNMS